MIWLFFCLIVAVIYPIVDGRHVLATAGRLAWGAVTGKSKSEAHLSTPGEAYIFNDSEKEPSSASKPGLTTNLTKS